MGAVCVALGVLILLPDWEAACTTQTLARRSSRNGLFIVSSRLLMVQFAVQLRLELTENGGRTSLFALA